jgi:hypothetical protein
MWNEFMKRYMYSYFATHTITMHTIALSCIPLSLSLIPVLTLSPSREREKQHDDTKKSRTRRGHPNNKKNITTMHIDRLTYNERKQLYEAARTFFSMRLFSRLSFLLALARF